MLPTELLLLGASTVLLLAHVLVQAQSVTLERGLRWNAGPRDGASPRLGLLAGRAQRALTNFNETYPAFAALALALAVAERTGGLGETGAWVWLAARLVYLPLYLLGVPYLRSICWLASIAGLAMMLARLLGWG